MDGGIDEGFLIDEDVAIESILYLQKLALPNENIHSHNLKWRGRRKCHGLFLARDGLVRHMVILKRALSSCAL